ncbi:MAG: GIY-YIG nuclease family protein [Kiritimatiellia bacterium]
MVQFFYVYVIDSLSRPGQYYIGFTENLEDRLKHHNAGAVPSTKLYRPWTYRTCTAFKDRQRALDFERYLKTHSGRAFLAKHL